MAALSGDVRLEGRLFNLINYEVITFAQEAYIHKLMRETGLDIPIEFGEHETTIEYQTRMQARILDTLKLPELLGGFLLPAGTTEDTWTEETAAATAKFIRGLKNREDRNEVHRLGFQVNIYFFGEGLNLLKVSQNSLESQEAMPPASKGSPQPIGAS